MKAHANPPMIPPSPEDPADENLIKNIASVLLASQTPSAPPLEKSLVPFMTRVSPPLASSILATAASSPAPLLSTHPKPLYLSPGQFQRREASALPRCLPPFPCPVLQVQRRQVASSLLHPPRPPPSPSPPTPSWPPEAAKVRTRHRRRLLCATPPAYHLANQIFQVMRHLRLRQCSPLRLSPLPHHLSPSVPFSLFHEMVSLGVSPSINTFNILIYGFCARAQFTDAHALLSRMAGFGVHPDTITCNTILDGYCKRGMWKDARDLLTEMKTKDIPQNRSTYNTIIAAYCRQGWLKEARKAIEAMTGSNFPPDIWTYNMLVARLCCDGRIDEAFRLKDEMERLHSPPDVSPIIHLSMGASNAAGAPMRSLFLER